MIHMVAFLQNRKAVMYGMRSCQSADVYKRQAVSSDGIHFERMSDRPFLENGGPGSWNECESGHPYVFVDDDDRVYLLSLIHI